MKAGLLLLLVSCAIFAQEVNIVPYLKLVEKGDVQLVRSELADLQLKYPESQNLKFLDAVITEDGDIAVDKYQAFYNNYPDNPYADASLYRIFSYYFALGVYQKADSYLQKLKSEYPASPYINAADRKIPDNVNYVSAYPEQNFPKQVKSKPAPVKQTAQPKVDIPAVKEEPKREVYRFTVQVGAFLNGDNARSLSEKIAADGYFTNVFSKTVGGSNFNIVVAGKLKTKEEADPIIEYLANSYKAKGRVIEYDFGGN